MQYSVASLKRFLILEGLSDIPVGIDLYETDFGGNPPILQETDKQKIVI